MQPRSAEVSRGQPRSAEISGDHPRSAEISPASPAPNPRYPPRSLFLAASLCFCPPPALPALASSTAMCTKEERSKLTARARACTASFTVARSPSSRCACFHTAPL